MFYTKYIFSRLLFSGIFLHLTFFCFLINLGKDEKWNEFMSTNFYAVFWPFNIVYLVHFPWELIKKKKKMDLINLCATTPNS